MSWTAETLWGDGSKVFEANRLVWTVVAIPTILIALTLVLGIGIK